MPESIWAATQSFNQPYGGDWSALLQPGRAPAPPQTYAGYVRDFTPVNMASVPLPKDYGLRAGGIEGAPRSFEGRAGGGTRPA